MTQLRAMREGTPMPGHSILYFRAWPLIWGTMLTTVLAVLIGGRRLDARRRLPDGVRPGRRCGACSTRSSGCSPAVPSVDLRPDRDPRARAVDRTNT